MIVRMLGRLRIPIFPFGEQLKQDEPIAPGNT